MINLENTFKLAMSGVKITNDVRIDNIHADFDKRINDLGLNNLSNLDSDERFKAIEERLWVLADKVNKPVILYEQEDYQASIDFLELFSIYACCLSRIKSSSNYITESGVKIIRQDEIGNDKSVLKLIRSLEDLNKIVHNSTDIISKKETIKNMKKYVNKVFANDLGITERRALNNKVNEAKAILSNLV